MFKIKRSKFMFSLVSVFLIISSLVPNFGLALEGGVPQASSKLLSDSMETPKVAIISCCYGTIEATTKPIVDQSVPCDKIFFTNRNAIKNRGNWIIDKTPYHLTNNKYLNTNYTNSWKNNKNNYMICKYYKAQFMEIPRLQKYDYIFMLDGTMEITNKDCVKMLIEKTEKENSNMVCWMSPRQKGELYNEAVSHCNNSRWKTTKFRGQEQPYQDVMGQYYAYVKDGYTTEYWKKQNISDIYGVFFTGFCFYKVNKDTKKFLDLWYQEILKWTTECQLSFAYVLQKNSDYKFSVLPDKNITGGYLKKSNVHIRYGHGK